MDTKYCSTLVMVDASFGQRFGANIIDGLLWLCVVFPSAFIQASNKEAAAVLGGAFIGLYLLQLALLTTSGQTLGKMLVGIRVVDVEEGKPAGFVRTVLVRTVLTGLLSVVPFVGWLYSMVDGCLIFRADRRCLHDHMARTKVVLAH